LNPPETQTAFENTADPTPAPAARRRLDNWIEAFVRYSATIQAPELFRRWAGIGMISAVMERKVWAHTKGSVLYPNLYLVLVAPPGVGKSNVLSMTENLLRSVPGICVAPSSLTTASLVDSVALAESPAGGHSLQAVASELGVFLPAYDPSYMNTLTKLYDGEHYEERRRTGKVNHLVVDRPLLSVIGGTTPSYLNSFLPEGAWDQGFTSRTIFVYSEEILKPDIWGSDTDETHLVRLRSDLVHDLRTISRVCGRATWTSQAQEAITAWYHDDLKPIPEHPKLAHYNSRRLAHLLKLCMSAMMARGDGSCSVTFGDYLTARKWLLDVEAVMSEIFNASVRGLQAHTLTDASFYVQKTFFRDGRKPVSEQLLVTFLRDRMRVGDVTKAIEVMLRSGDIQRIIINGMVNYIPR
jgi:hypothetical protein